MRVVIVSKVQKIAHKFHVIFTRPTRGIRPFSAGERYLSRPRGGAGRDRRRRGGAGRQLERKETSIDCCFQSDTM